MGMLQYLNLRGLFNAKTIMESEEFQNKSF